MKRIIAFLALVFTGAAFAATADAGPLSALQLPAAIPTAYYYRNLSEGQSFSIDGSVLGVSQSSRSDTCSGRGCQPVVWTQVYNVAWDTSGNVESATLCGARRHHPPQIDSWIYEAGFDATSCKAFTTLATATVVQIDGVNYYYVTTNGLAEIANGQTKSYVYLF